MKKEKKQVKKVKKENQKKPASEPKKAERPSYFKDMAKAKKEFDKGLKLLDELTQSYKKFFMHTIKVSGSREKAMCLMYSVHHSLACLEMDELNRVWPLDGVPNTPAK